MRRKRASVYSFSEDEVPPADDPRWADWASLTASRLLTRKTTAELLRDSPEFSFALLTNILAWMDLRKLVSKTREGKTLFWMAAVPVPPPEMPPRCCYCGGGWAERQAGLVCVMCGRMPEDCL